MLPKFRAQVNSDEFLRWSQVFDVSAFDDYLLQSYGLHALMRECMPDGLQPVAATLNCTAPINNTVEAMPVPFLGGQPYHAGTAFYSATLLAMQPARYLQAIIDTVLRKLGGPDNFACLHLRTEVRRARLVGMQAWACYPCSLM